MKNQLIILNIVIKQEQFFIIAILNGTHFVKKLFQIFVYSMQKSVFTNECEFSKLGKQITNWQKRGVFS